MNSSAVGPGATLFPGPLDAGGVIPIMFGMLAFPTGAPVLIDHESAMVIARLTQVVMAVGIAGAVTMCADCCGWTAWLHGTVATALPPEAEPQRLTEDR